VTGAVTWEAAAFFFGVVFVAGAGVAGFLIWVYRLVVGLRRDQRVDVVKLEELVRERDTVAQLERERAKLVEEGLRKMITDQAQHVAETYATKEGVQVGLGRVEKSIDRLSEQVGNAVDRLSNRLDRFMEPTAPAPPARRPRGG
jgi:ubiquinone biosynthesis protein UbiJ